MSKEDLDKIYSYAVSNDKEFDGYGNSEKEFKVNVFSSQSEEALFIRDLVRQNGKRVYSYVLKEYGGSFASFDPNASHIAKFDSGYGMHEHFDSSKPNDIATLIYLNDNYSGGEIYFPEYDIEIKPKAGDLICFPDNPNYVHGVKKVESGTRYTTPRWFTRMV